MKRLYHILLSIVLLFSAASLNAQEIEIPVIKTKVDTIAWKLIPAGDFYEGPHLHVTSVPYDYEIMLTEVTNDEYAAFLNEALAAGKIKFEDNVVSGYYPGDPFNGHKHEFEIKAGFWPYMDLNERGTEIIYDGKVFKSKKGYGNHPVINVTWFGANAFAQFYGWRLPSEYEWEKAARGSNDTRCYPWGDDFENNRANFYSSHDLFEKIVGKSGGTNPVAMYDGDIYEGFQTADGRSAYGLYDMAGNVWEWCGDDYPDVHYRYMRGGSNYTYENDLRVWARNSAGPDYYGMDVGFRCARDVKPDKVKAEPDEKVTKKEETKK
jgi:formylglycine-generating enzyme required for sulfatase activity